MRHSKFLVASLLVVSLVVTQVGFQGQDTCRRTKTSESISTIAPSILPVVDTLDGIVGVKIRLADSIGKDSCCDASLTAFLRTLSYNNDISITAIECGDNITASDIAEVLQSNSALGPWKGVSVTSQDNNIIIQGHGDPVVIPVVGLEENVKADVMLYIGAFLKSLDSDPSVFNVQRMLLAPTGVSLLSEFEDLENLALPGDSEIDGTSLVSVSEVSALALVLESLKSNLGGAYISRADMFLPQGDLSIKPGASVIDISSILETLGISNGGVNLNVTEVSGILKGARRMEAIITLPGEITMDMLKEVFNTTDGISVAAESASTSSMFNTPSDTSMFILDARMTTLTAQPDGSTRVNLRGWVGDYSMAGMMVASLTEMGRQLSELGLLSDQTDLQLVAPNVEYKKPSILERIKTVLINGAAGRIGLNILRSLIGDPNFSVVAVNGVRSAEALRLGLMHDEILGPTNAEITTGSTTVKIVDPAINYYIELDGVKQNFGADIGEANQVLAHLHTSGIDASIEQSKIEEEVEYIEINGHRVYVFNSRKEDSIKDYMPQLFEALGLSAEYLMEASGNYTSVDKLQPFFDANIGIEHAFISAPAKDDTLQVVPGVNTDQLVAVSAEGVPAVLSAGSCTTNNTAPAVVAMLKLLEGTGVNINGVEINTIHGLTQTQAQVIPLQVRDIGKAERQRPGALTIVPTSTGAAKVVPQIINGINNISGVSSRVGNPCGSESQLTFHLDGFSPVSEEAIVTGLKSLSQAELLNVLFVNEGDVLDSGQINGVDVTSIVEASTIDIVPIYDGEGNHISDSIVFNTWYDNEWSFTQQYLRLVTMAALLEENPDMSADELFETSDRLGENAYIPSN